MFYEVTRTKQLSNIREIFSLRLMDVVHLF